MEQQYVIAALVGLLVLAGAGYVVMGLGGQDVPADTGATDTDWRDVELTDVHSGETFRLSGFEKPVLVESFAVWCPTCTQQQGIIKDLHEQVGDDILSVSLNTDPNEDAQKVLNHAERHGFDWRYAVSPASMTNAMVGEYGRSWVAAPQIPMVLICPDGTATRLENGIKPVSFLTDAVERECGA